MTLSPAYQTATFRRELRRQVRNLLGSSRDDAPSAVVALKALRLMSELVSAATNGHFDVLLVNRKGQCVNRSEAVNFAIDTNNKVRPAGAVVLDCREQETLRELLDHVPQGLLQRFPATLDKIGYGEHRCDNCEGIDPDSCMMNARV
jgi:hypothetical protein